MVYDRPYMRTKTLGQESLWALKVILITTLSVFVLQKIFEVWFQSRFLIAHFSLVPFLLTEKGFFWTLLTYALLHASLSHFIVNAIGIFFIGRILEPRLGSKRFLTLYLLSALSGSIAWLALHSNGNGFLIGASAALSGIIVYFCLLNWEQPMTFLLFLIIPITVKPKWIFWSLLALECFLLLFYELSVDNYKIANSAHLGGMLSGFLYYQFLSRQSIRSFSQESRSKIQNWLKKKNTAPSKDRNFSVNINSHHELKTEVDRILDKINTKGFKALEPKERDILERARKQLKSL